MAHLRGTEGDSPIRAWLPETRVLILATYADVESVFSAPRRAPLAT
jgi:hypothetical protein